MQAILASGEVVPREIARFIARLWKTQSIIGPGGACTQAAHRFLKTGDPATCGALRGQAGNGTAMRTAVLGLFFLGDPERLPGAVAEVSRITHHDPRSVAGGIAIAKAAQLLASEDEVPERFCQDIAETIEPYESNLAMLVRGLPHLVEENPETAVATIAWSGMAAPEFGKPIITPFVIPTVLAALWCVLRHLDSWPNAVSSAIRLGGDVDTLGAIVGALMGIRLGQGAIPRHLVDTVHDGERLRILALSYHVLVVGKGEG